MTCEALQRPWSSGSTNRAGNGFISRRLAERIAQAGPRAIKTGAWTLRIEREAGGFGVITWEHGTLQRYLARAVLCRAAVPRAPDHRRPALRTASQRQPGLSFAHTDVQGAPAYENAIASAHDAVEAIRKHLT